jgi:hypothetical protein
MATVFFTPHEQYFKHTINDDDEVAQLENASLAEVVADEVAICMNSFEQFSSTPLTAGDVIDRAVRLYRQHFLLFLRIVLLPSLIAYAGGIAWAVGVRNISFADGDERLVRMIALAVAGGLFWLAGKALFLMLLGGASRALVWHYFNGAPLKTRAVYQAVCERSGSLLAAAFIVTGLLAGLLMLAYAAVSLALVSYALFAASVLRHAPEWFLALSHLVFGALVVGAAAVFLLLLYARLVYIPQVMMVEGRDVFSAIRRSSQLARPELRRVATLLLFQLAVAVSLYWLLMAPLGWYGYGRGIELSPFSAAAPLWYGIAQQTLSQLGQILIAPIVLLGFTLLYLDTRVRKEGFDLELLANRVFPAVRRSYAVESQRRRAQAPAASEALPQPAPQPSGEFAEVFVETIEVLPSTAPTVAQEAFGSPLPGDEATVIAIPLPVPDQEAVEFVPLATAYVEPQVQTVTLSLSAPEPRVKLPRSLPTETATIAVPQGVTKPKPSAPAKRRCSGCGSETDPDIQFCLVCGELF